MPAQVLGDTRRPNIPEQPLNVDRVHAESGRHGLPQSPLLGITKKHYRAFALVILSESE